MPFEGLELVGCHGGVGLLALWARRRLPWLVDELQQRVPLQVLGGRAPEHLEQRVVLRQVLGRRAPDVKQALQELGCRCVLKTMEQVKHTR